MKYTLIALSGDDRIDFLQGQLTQDLSLLDTGRSLPAAWCNAKGRVLLTCRLLSLEDRLLMALPEASGDAALQRLAMYRLRAKVDIALESSWQTLAFSGAAAGQVEQALKMHPEVEQHWQPNVHAQRLAGADGSLEIIAERSSLAAIGLDPTLALSEPDWSGARITAGLVDIDSPSAEKFTPHMLNLDLTGAISFDKGCYTGQEVVARTQHLGKVKRRLARYKASAAGIGIGDKLALDGADVAEAVNVSGRDLLAVVAVDQAGQVLEFPGGTAHPETLPYSDAG